MIGMIADKLRNFEPLRRFIVTRRDNYSRAVDRRLGIRTTPDSRERDRRIHPKGDRAFSDSRWYEAMDYRQLDRFLKPLGLTTGDVVYDIGCGMGRIVCAAALRDVRESVGVELDPALADDARKNAETLKGRRAAIRIITADATKVDYADGTVFILFNPFGAQTMAATLERIRQSLAARPRAIRIAYFNPACEEVYTGSGWLECTGRDKSVWFRNTASYWRNTTPDGATRSPAA